MKHFKKALALCISLALLLSVCPVALAADSAAFTDIGGTTHAHAIQVLADAGIMKGVGGGKFDPNGAVNRATAATVLGRMAGVTPEDTDAFSDVVNGSWYSGYVGWASDNGVILGDGNGHFSPDATITAAHWELMLSRYAKLIGVDYDEVITSAEPLNRGELAEMAYVLYTMMDDCVFATDGALYIVSYDAGPSVDKVIVTLPEAVDAVKAEGAAVATAGTERQVTGATLSDEKGNPVEGASKYVTLTLKPSAGGIFGSVELAGQSYSVWPDKYMVSAQFGIELNGESKIASLNANCAGNRIIPDAERYNTGVLAGTGTNPLTSKEETLNVHYVAYEPDGLKNDKAKNPLVIWLHGAGEGGSDPTIPIMANDASNLAGEQIQSYFTTKDGQKGAYVLVPQCPTIWMDRGDNTKYWGDKPSRYTEILMDVIKQYVAANGDIDTSRIYLGGCSNGGYMTVDLMIAYPDYWAACFPVCSVYAYNTFKTLPDGSYDLSGPVESAFPSFPPFHLNTQTPSDTRWMTDEKIEAIKDIPVWFVHSASDPVVTVDYTSMPIYRALVQAGAANAWFSLFENALNADLEQSPTFGHAVWQNLLNDTVKGVQNVDAIKNSAADDKTMGFVPSDATGGGSDSNGYDSLFAWLNDQNNTNVTVTGTQQGVIKAEDWGPVVNKTIITLDTTISASSVTAKSFKVTEKRMAFDYATMSNSLLSVDRPVTAAYASDAAGNKVTTDSKYITLEMDYKNDGTVFENNAIQQSEFSTNYNLVISLTAPLTAADGTSITRISVGKLDASKALVPEMEGVDVTGVYEGEKYTLHYASFEPANAKDGKKHPLVIWVHGMGEGGTDPTIAMIGNKVVALTGKDFQDTMGGAYILAPQTPGFWLQYDENDSNKWGDNPGVKSIYTEDLKGLIDKYVADHPNIDTDRIIIGGCSNGGYMTMNMIIEYPDFFAAAFPICEAYQYAPVEGVEGSGITADELAAIKDLPIWFVWSKDDPLVVPSTYEDPTVAALKDAGAPNLHTSIFEHVVDTSGRYTDADGNPATYFGHASWYYFFNNECKDEAGANLWQWLAQQSK